MQGAGAAETEAAELKTLVAESYAPADPGPYPQDKPPENQVRFTPVQVPALFCLLSERAMLGLTERDCESYWTSTPCAAVFSCY